MTQEENELLLKDLCARLPYGVKAVLKQTNCHDSINKVSEKDIYSFRTGKPLEEDCGQHDYYKVIVTDIKPYLFPLSSMTESQNDSWRDAFMNDLAMSASINYPESEKYLALSHVKYLQWLYENHFDVNGLIEKGIAIDATGLNIY